MHTWRTAAYYILVLEVVCLALLALAFFVPLPGNLEARIVQSGSMEPAIPVGALVLVTPQEHYAPGDVIMFGEDTKSLPTTHRVVEVVREEGATAYVTKGDANEEADQALAAHSAVFGSVALSVPRLGYVLDFARSREGFLFMAVIPAALILLDELLALVGALRKEPAAPRKPRAPVSHGGQSRTRTPAPQQARTPRVRLDGVTVVLRPL